MSVLARLYRGARHEHGVAVNSERQRDVGELARPEPAIAVRERALQLDHSRLWIDGVVDEGQHPVGLRFSLHLGSYAELVVAIVALDVGKKLLRHREGHVNRRHLVNGDQRHIVGLDHVAHLDREIAGASVDGRLDGAVGEVHSCVLYRGFVGGYDLLCRLRLGHDLVVLLARDHAFLVERFPTHRLRLRVRGIGTVPGDISIRLRQRGLVRTAVNDEEQTALLDVLPFAESHLHDLACHHRLHRDGGERLDVADRLHLHGNVFKDGGGNGHGHRVVARLLGLLGVVLRAASHERQ